MALNRTKVRWRFRKILWPSLIIWTLINKNFACILQKLFTYIVISLDEETRMSDNFQDLNFRLYIPKKIQLCPLHNSNMNFNSFLISFVKIMLKADKKENFLFSIFHYVKKWKICWTLLKIIQKYWIGRRNFTSDYLFILEGVHFITFFLILLVL